MNRFVIAPTPDGPFWMIVRNGNHSKPAGEVIALRLPSEKMAVKIAIALEVHEQAEEMAQRKIEKLGDFIIYVNNEIQKAFETNEGIL